MTSSHRKAYKNFILLYHSIAVLLFLGMGIFLLSSPSNVMQINRQYKTALGILLVVYSLYRAYKAYIKFRYLSNEEEEYEQG